MNFLEKLKNAQSANNSKLCVGIDTGVKKKSLEIIDQTYEHACCYKFNLAHHLSKGEGGLEALKALIASVPNNIPTILDSKFGDIENTCKYYANFSYKYLGVDAVTFSPCLGSKGLKPFIAGDGFAFILARTTESDLIEQPYERISGLYKNNSNVGLVMGANDPQAISKVRETNENSWLLVPGIGAQGGDIKSVVEVAKQNFLINVSRAIMEFEKFGFLSHLDAALSFKRAINA